MFFFAFRTAAAKLFFFPVVFFAKFISLVDSWTDFVVSFFCSPARSWLAETLEDFDENDQSGRSNVGISNGDTHGGLLDGIYMEFAPSFGFS